MPRCSYPPCSDPADGLFFLAPGTDVAELWITEDEARIEAVPLCQWHALLVGDQRVATGHRPG